VRCKERSFFQRPFWALVLDVGDSWRWLGPQNCASLSSA